MNTDDDKVYSAKREGDKWRPEVSFPTDKFKEMLGGRGRVAFAELFDTEQEAVEYAKENSSDVGTEEWWNSARI